MGLVQNLKKRLNSLVDKILVELSYHYIIQKARQTTRKLDNSSKIKSSLNSLTTEHQSTIIATSSQGISEKTIMEMKTTEEAVADARAWSLTRMDSEDISDLDAESIYVEFQEWIEPLPELDILSLDKLEPFYEDDKDVDK